MEQVVLVARTVDRDNWKEPPFLVTRARHTSFPHKGMATPAGTTHGRLQVLRHPAMADINCKRCFYELNFNKDKPLSRKINY